MAWKGENMNYEEMSLVELRAAAKEKGLKGTTAMRKSELLSLLMKEKEKEQKILQEEKAAPVRTVQEKKTAPAKQNTPTVETAALTKEGDSRTYYNYKENNR